MIREVSPAGDDGSQDSLSQTIGSCSIPQLFPNAVGILDPLGLERSGSSLFAHMPAAPPTLANNSFARYQYADDGDGQLLMPPHDPASASPFRLPAGAACKGTRRHLSIDPTDGSLSPRKYIQHERATTWVEEEESSWACAILAEQMRQCLLDETHTTLPSQTSDKTQAKLQMSAQASDDAHSGRHRGAMTLDSVTPSTELLSQYRTWWRRERLLSRDPLVPTSVPPASLEAQASVPLSPLSPLTTVCQVMSNNSDSGCLTGSFEHNNTNNTSCFHPLQAAFSANVSLPTALYHHHSLLDDEPASPVTPAPLLQPTPTPTTTATVFPSTCLHSPPQPPIARAQPTSPSPPVSSVLTPADNSDVSGGRRPSRLLLPSLTPSAVPSRNASKPATPLLRPSRRSSAVPSLLQSPMNAGMTVPMPPGSGERAVKKTPLRTSLVVDDNPHDGGTGSRDDILDSPLPQRFFMLEPREPISAGTAEPLSGSEYKPRAVTHAASSSNFDTMPNEHNSPTSGKTRFTQFLRLFSSKSRDASDTFEPGARLVGATSAPTTAPTASHFGHFASPSPPASSPHAVRRMSYPSQNQSSASIPHMNTAPPPSADDYAPVAQTESAIDALTSAASSPDFFQLRSMRSI